jgi:hypothetical protein
MGPDEVVRVVAPEGGRQNSEVSYGAVAGVGGGGGLVFRSLGEYGTERRYFGVFDADGLGGGEPATFDGTQQNQWHASVKVRMAELAQLAEGSKTKAHVRLGFVGDVVIANPEKPQETLNKAPQTLSMFADYKVEWENDGTGLKQPKISVEVKSWNGTVENKPAAKFERSFASGDAAANAALLDGWYRIDVSATRTGLARTDYLIAARIHDLGEDGTGEPVLVGSNEFVVAQTNTALATDTTVYPVLMLETAKELSEGEAGSVFAVDDWSFRVSADPGPEPPPPPSLYEAPGGGPVGIGVDLPFESVAGLDGFAYVNQNDTTVGYAAGAGTGQPATGAGVFQSTSASGVDKRVLAVADVASRIASGPETQTWTAQALVHAPSMSGTPAGSKYKAHVRLGFLGEAVIADPTKPQDVWKLNPGVHADFKIEWEHADGKTPKLSIEGKSSPGGNSEAKTSKFETSTFDPARWYLATLAVRRMVDRDDPQAAHLLAVDVRVYDAGADGLAEPVLVGGAEMGVTARHANEAFSTDTTLHAAYMLEGEKGYLGTPYYQYFVDDLSFRTVRPPGVPPPSDPPTLAITRRSDGAVELTWGEATGWRLFQSSSLGEGSWTEVAGAASPWVVVIPDGAAFYRLEQR